MAALSFFYTLYTEERIKVLKRKINFKKKAYNLGNSRFGLIFI
jgi:hypothetical protein